MSTLYTGRKYVSFYVLVENMSVEKTSRCRGMAHFLKKCETNASFLSTFLITFQADRSAAWLQTPEAWTISGAGVRGQGHRRIGACQRFSNRVGGRNCEWPRLVASISWPAVWPDWPIYLTLGHFSKPLATINLPKSPTFLGNFCKGVKIFNFYIEIIFEQLL